MIKKQRRQVFLYITHLGSKLRPSLCIRKWSKKYIYG